MLERRAGQMLRTRGRQHSPSTSQDSGCRAPPLDTFPDPYLFPDYGDTLALAFQKEAELFFDSIVREDRPAVDLLNGNYTFVNERLAQHYGIANIKGVNFRRVELPEDSRRRGLLGKGSILVVTALPNRTSPVVRGKWVLQILLGAPPP
jgi:hypothetical protein